MTLRIIMLLTTILYLSACGGTSNNESNNTNETIEVGTETTITDSPTIASPDNSISDNVITDTPETSEPNTSDPVTPDNSTPEDSIIIAAEQSKHDFESTHFSGSDNCTKCHDGMTDETGEDLSIVNSWKTTMMANSARDPFWKAKVASEVSRNPALSEMIQDKCSQCHMPMAHVEATFVGDSTKMFGDGFLSPTNPHFDEAAEGVSCTLCHQIENTAVFGTDAATSGKFVIADNPSDRKLYGPVINPFQMPMINSVGFTPMGSDHIQYSALCGSCHDVKTPVVDTSGALTADEFPEQMLYSEWKYSSFATEGSEQSCQSCHMPSATGKAKFANRPAFIEAREDFSQHQFVGANSVMLDILQNNSAELGIPVSDFSKTIDLSREMLKSAANISIEDIKLSEEQLVFNIRVRNNSGHKFPSGFPSRRAWLHIEILDANNNIVFESGAIDKVGKILGVDADDNSNTYEHHHQSITSADQVQVYESIMANTNGDINYTLLNSASYLKDNRLMPQGMDKTTIPNDISVQGEARDDDNFVAGGDLVTYRLPNFGGAHKIRASLNYQSISYAFAKDLFNQNNPDALINSFELMYKKARFRHEEVISVEAMF